MERTRSDVAKKQKLDSVLIVTHGGFSVCLLDHILRESQLYPLSPTEEKRIYQVLPNCGYIHFVWTKIEDGSELIEFKEIQQISHMSSMPDGGDGLSKLKDTPMGEALSECLPV